MKCIYCGEEFEPNKRGVKRTYCHKIECKKRHDIDTTNKYIKKKKAGLPIRKKQNTKIKKIEEKEIEKTINFDSKMYREEEIIYVKDIVPNTNENVIDVLEFAKELGALRYKGEQLRKKLKEEQSKCDTEDSVFLHKLESMQKMTVADAIKLVTENGKNRTERRDTKTLSVVMNTLMNGIIMNPHEYAIKSIKSGVNRDIAYAVNSEIAKKV